MHISIVLTLLDSPSHIIIVPVSPSIDFNRKPHPCYHLQPFPSRRRAIPHWHPFRSTLGSWCGMKSLSFRPLMGRRFRKGSKLCCASSGGGILKRSEARPRVASWHDVKHHRGTRWITTGFPLGVPILRQLRNARGISATPRRGCFERDAHSISSSRSMTEAQRWVKSFEEPGDLELGMVAGTLSLPRAWGPVSKVGK